MKKILICAPIHEEKDIFELYLKHLRNLEIPANVEVSRFFILHNCEHLKDLINHDEQCFINNNKSEYKKDDNTHYWKQDNFNDVVAMKNMLIKIMLQQNFDYIFYVDSDLMLHKNTLVDLFKADKDMISELFWTKWTKEGHTEELPNCWHYDHYGIFKEDLDKW